MSDENQTTAWRDWACDECLPVGTDDEIRAHLSGEMAERRQRHEKLWQERDELQAEVLRLRGLLADAASSAPQGAGTVPMVLHCPECRARHVDEGDFATKPHHTHACQSCGFTWRPAVVPTVGVRFLPGFKNEAAPVSAPQGGPDGPVTIEHATAIASVAMAFGRVQRATMHPDGSPENDATHTVMLAMLVADLARAEGLDVGLAVQFAIVHDLPETYAGDTCTARALSPEEAAAKADREAASLDRLRSELGPCWSTAMIDRYEAQREPEAVLVRYADKILPKLTHALDGGQALASIGMEPDEAEATMRAQGEKLAAKAPTFQATHALFDAACARAVSVARARPASLPPQGGPDGLVHLESAYAREMDCSVECLGGGERRALAWAVGRFRAASPPHGEPAVPPTTEQSRAVLEALHESTEPAGFLGFDAWWDATESKIDVLDLDDIARAAWDAALDYASTQDNGAASLEASAASPTCEKHDTPVGLCSSCVPGAVEPSEPLKAWAALVVRGPDETAGKLAEPSEDRSEPPHEYEVVDDVLSDTGLLWRWDAIDDEWTHSERGAAVAACWAHRDRITAPLRAEQEALRSIAEEWREEARMLRERETKAKADVVRQRARVAELERERDEALSKAKSEAERVAWWQRSDREARDLREAERDDARVNLASLRHSYEQMADAWRSAVRERDDARAAGDRLRDQCAAKEATIANLRASLYDATGDVERLDVERDRLRSEVADQAALLDASGHDVERMTAEVERLRVLINTPHTEDWTDAVRLEAAHQIERWGTEHDAGKAPADWFWLLGYLGGKALHAAAAGDVEKAKHHTISSGAALLNWHRALAGTSTAMRPGIDTPTEPTATPSPKAEREAIVSDVVERAEEVVDAQAKAYERGRAEGAVLASRAWRDERARLLAATPSPMTTDEFCEVAEPGWYRVRFMHGEEPSNPDSWGPWHCVEVYEGNRYDGGFIGDKSRPQPFHDLPDADRYQWGAAVRMPDDEPTERPTGDEPGTGGAA